MTDDEVIIRLGNQLYMLQFNLSDRMGKYAKTSLNNAVKLYTDWRKEKGLPEGICND